MSPGGAIELKSDNNKETSGREFPAGGAVDANILKWEGREE